MAVAVLGVFEIADQRISDRRHEQAVGDTGDAAGQQAALEIGQKHRSVADDPGNMPEVV